jgi:hypothetical protein
VLIDLALVVKEAAFLLPQQAILENFVHHNPWEMIQHRDFHDAEAYLRDTLSKPSPAAKLHKLLSGTGKSSSSLADPRVRANAATVELCAAFLDRGLAKWSAAGREHGFLNFFAELEGSRNPSWRVLARDVAKRVRAKRAPAGPEEVLRDNLQAMAGGTTMTEASLTRALRATLWDLPGWAGMFQVSSITERVSHIHSVETR